MCFDVELPRPRVDSTDFLILPPLLTVWYLDFFWIPFSFSGTLSPFVPGKSVWIRTVQSHYHFPLESNLIQTGHVTPVGPRRIKSRIFAGITGKRYFIFSTGFDLGTYKPEDPEATIGALKWCPTIDSRVERDKLIYFSPWIKQNIKKLGYMSQ